MNTNTPGPLNVTTSGNNDFVTAPLSDKGRQGDLELGSQSDSVLTGANIDSSGVTLGTTVPELSVAYNRTFLQITPPSLSKKEMLAQLEPFSRTVSTDLTESLISSEYAIEEANVQASQEILNIIEKAQQEGNNNRKHYDQTGVNAAVTDDTSPSGSEGVHAQDLFIQSLSTIAHSALETPSSCNSDAATTSDATTTQANSLALSPSSGHRHGGNINIEGSNNSPGRTVTVGGLINLLMLYENNGGDGTISVIQQPHLSAERLSSIAQKKALQGIKEYKNSQDSSQGGASPYNESEQISYEFLNAEEENSFEESNALTRMMQRDEDSLMKFQNGGLRQPFPQSLHRSLDTLKDLISHPSWSTAISA